MAENHKYHGGVVSSGLIFTSSFFKFIDFSKGY